MVKGVASSPVHPPLNRHQKGGGQAVPSRYKRVLDKATGKHYYYDKETKETVSELQHGHG